MKNTPEASGVIFIIKEYHTEKEKERDGTLLSSSSLYFTKIIHEWNAELKRAIIGAQLIITV